MLGFDDTGMQPAAFYYAFSASYSTYDEALPNANTFAAITGLTIPFRGAGASARAASAVAADPLADASRISLAATYSAADNFLDAGNTQHGTVGVRYSMPVMDGLSFGTGITVGRTATDNGGSTDLVGADSFDYSEFTAGVIYSYGALTCGSYMSHTDTSEHVGAESTDSVNTTSASISYTVGGVTALFGYTINATENGVQKNNGPATHIRVSMDF